MELRSCWSSSCSNCRIGRQSAWMGEESFSEYIGCRSLSGSTLGKTVAKDGGSGVRRLLLTACPMPEGRECFFGMKTLLSFSDEDREKRQRHIKKGVKASMTLKQMAYSCGFLAKIIFLKKSQKSVDILKEA